ncbi:MAG: ABC transporter ATP-binding protein [Eubacteriales bacterium]
MAKARNTFNVDEELEATFNMEMAKRSFVYIGKEKKLFLWAIISQIIATLCGLSAPFITATAIDKAIPQKDMNYLMQLSAILVLSIVLNILFTTISNRINNLIGQNIVRHIRHDLFVHLQKLSFSYYDSRPHGKILVRVVNYVNSVSNILSNGLINMLMQLFNLIFIVLFMFLLSPELSLVVMSGVPFIILFLFAIKPAQRRGWQEYSAKSSNLNAYLGESISCMKITRLFTREEHNTEIFSSLLTDSKKAWYKAVYASSAVQPVINFISRAVAATLIMYGLFICEPMVSFGVLLGMVQYCNRFWQPINQIANIYNNFINNIAYLERIYETLDEPVEVRDKEDATEMPPMQGDVEFRNVTFSYDTEIVVLNNINFSVKKGESIALVGHTGSGKTTIINLLSRFYNCSEGAVLIDGVDISGVTIASLRRQMGLMMQDSFVFSTSIMENLRYGNLEADDETLIQAAKMVCAHEFIQELPNGYETIMADSGNILSQGQKQLLALARTMATDPKILILDEATSSVDTKTERLLQEGLSRMLKGRTSFIVAHRLSTIKACDKIMYIHHGEIAEVGSHDELLEKKGFYYQLCQNQ